MDLTQIQEIVMMAGDKLVTDSRRVARDFGKRHADVLRSIRGLLRDLPPEDAERNFALCFENNDLQNGKPLQVVQMTKDGFLLLAMGFTGKVAMRVKLAYINAFNAMAEFIQAGQRGLWQQMHALIARDSDSKVRASFGSRLMLERKKLIPEIERQYQRLNADIQLPLVAN